jgi:hypothetical protein
VTETGRTREGRLRPWPWAANTAGQSHWFDTEAALAQFIDAHLETGATNIDIGCFQINYRWHIDEVGMVAGLIDPLTSARYAASLLQSAFARTHDWVLAAGAYHSSLPQFAARYQARFSSNYSGLDDSMDVGYPQSAVNAYPLLMPQSEAPRLGSLVSQGIGAIAPLATDLIFRARGRL